MPHSSETLPGALRRIHALEKVAEVLAEALEELRPGFAAKARAEISDWAGRGTTIAMIPEDERETIVDTFGNVFREPRSS